MKLFPDECTDLSYKKPFFRLIFFILMILLALFLTCYIHYSLVLIRVLVKILAVAMVLFGFLGVYSALGELGDVYFNRKKAKRRTADAKPFSMDTVLKMVKENDIIELEVSGQKGPITLGTTAMSTCTSSTSWDKRLYIGDMEYKTIEDFAQALLRLFPDGVVPVFTIDGLHPKHTVWGKPLKS